MSLMRDKFSNEFSSVVSNDFSPVRNAGNSERNAGNSTYSERNAGTRENCWQLHRPGLLAVFLSRTWNPDNGMC